MLLIDGSILRKTSNYDAIQAARSRWDAASDEDKRAMVVNEGKALPMRWAFVDYFEKQLENRRYSIPEGRYLQARAAIKAAREKVYEVAYAYFRALPLQYRIGIVLEDRYGLSGMKDSLTKLATVIGAVGGTAIIVLAFMSAGIPALLLGLAGALVLVTALITDSLKPQLDASGNPVETPVQTVARSVKAVAGFGLLALVLIGGGYAAKKAGYL